MNKSRLTPRAFRAHILSWSGFQTIVDLEARAYFRVWSSVLGQIVIEPLVYTAFLAVGLQSLLGGSVNDFLLFAFPGIIGIQAVRAFGKMIYRATIDRRWGILAIKVLSGVGLMGYVMGFTVVPAGVFVAQVLVITAVMLLLGASVSLSGWLMVIGIGLLMTIFWVCLAMLMTLSIQNYQQRDALISLSLLPLTFSAPIFYSLDTLPVYMQLISRVNPLTYQIIAMREALVGRIAWLDVLITLALAVLMLMGVLVALQRVELISDEH